jgi:DNA polymerase III delta prime subunit
MSPFPLHWLCYGPPGIGKTLSAVRYSRAEEVIAHDRWTSETTDDLPVDTLLYTTSVINTPSRISQDINMAREKVMSIVLDPLRREGSAALEVIRIRDERRRKELLDTPGFSLRDWPSVDPTYLRPTRNIERKSEQ